MVEFSLYQYLTAPGDLAGSADVVPFVKSIQLGNATIANRNDARRWLRDNVGDRIFAARRIENKGHTAITIRAISTTRDIHLKGDSTTQSVIQIDCFANGSNAVIRAKYAAECMRIAISHYAGTWGKSDVVTVGGVTVSRETMDVTAPRDSSGYWTIRMSTDYEINYCSNKVEV